MILDSIKRLTDVRDEAGHTIKFLSMDEAVKLKDREGQYVRLTGEDIRTEIRQVDKSKLQVEFVISSYRRDDYGTRFDPKGADLSQYRMNPIVLYRHMRDGGEYTLPIARGLIETLSVDADGKMHMVAEFTPEETFPFGFQVYKLVRDGFLNMASIGAQILGEELIEEGADGMKVKTIVFTKWKLFEWSVVPIGANDDALVASRDVNTEAEAKPITDFLTVARELSPQMTISVVRNDAGKGIITVTERGQVAWCSDGVEIPETEEQKKHREYFEQFTKVSKPYRALMDKLYKRVGLIPPANEEEAVKKITELVLCGSTLTDTIRKQVPVTRVPTADEMKTIAAKLAATVEGRKREALRSGTPLRKIADLVPQWTREALATYPHSL